MATVNRPPFYVPRPPPDTFWVGQPDAAAPIQLLAVSQAPTKNSWPYYNYDDGAVWQADPTPTNINTIPVTKNPYKSGSRQWPFNYYDSSPWSWEILPSGIPTQNLPSGQTPFKTRQWRLDYDDGSIWQARPIDYSRQPSVTPTATSQRWAFGYDDNAIWVGRPIDYSQFPPSPQTLRVKSRQWLFGNDDGSVWAWQQPTPLPLSQLLTLYAPSGMWVENYTEPPAWLGQAVGLPLANRTVAPAATPFYPDAMIFAAQNQPQDFGWSASMRFNQAIHTTFTTAQPFSNQTQTVLFRGDDGAVWQPKPALNTATRFNWPVPKLDQPWSVRMSTDHAGFWQGTPTASLTINLPVPVILAGGPHNLHFHATMGRLKSF